MEEVRIQISGAQGRTARYEAAVRRAGGQPVVGFCPRPDLLHSLRTLYSQGGSGDSYCF